MFQNSLKKLLKVYTSNYGINQNIRQLLLNLPDEIKKSIAEQYSITRTNANDSEEVWKNKSVDEKIKVIFIDYLFKYRRNKYTHEGAGFRKIGGICSSREALSKGEFDISSSAPIALENSEKTLVIECKYGDEALFLREVILICLAHLLGVLNEGWINRYRQAERMRRILIAITEEIKYNKRIMQGYFGTLTEGIRVSNENSPKFIIAVAEKVLEASDTLVVPIYHEFIRDYLKAATFFNQNIDSIDEERQGFQKNTEQVFKLITDSKIQSQIRSLWWDCEKLINEYPYWTYDYFYQNA